MRVAATICALAAAILLHADRCTAQPTRTSTPTATALPTGTVAACIGDCDGDAVVAINEMVLAVNVALGNVPMSECLAAACQDNQVAINCLVSAVRNGLNGCPATPTPVIRATPTPLPAGALGVRRFSLDPAESQFIAVFNPTFSVPQPGFEGFLELSAGPVFGGFAFIDITDASEYLSINLPGAGTALCLQVLREEFPIVNAGVLACNAGTPLGIQVVQDHNLGVVGTCRGGSSAGASCSSDDQCGDGACFTAAACAALGGSVEGPNRVHPGVCNGPLVGSTDTESSPAGTLVVAPDPNGLTEGLPIVLTQELSTPCGDEGVTGVRQIIGFTTGRSVGTVLNYNNQPGAMLSAEITGVPFSCAAWTQEDGPGTLVLSAPSLDTVVPGLVSDFLGEFKFVD